MSNPLPLANPVTDADGDAELVGALLSISLLPLSLLSLVLLVQGLEERILLTADIAVLLFKEEVNTTADEEEEEGGMGGVMRGVEDDGTSGREEEREREASVLAVLTSDFLGFDFGCPWLSPTTMEIK